MLAKWAVVAPLLIVAATRGANGGADETPDVDVDAREAARRLGIATPTFYKRVKAGTYPFTRFEGRKVLASLRGLQRYRREQCGT